MTENVKENTPIIRVKELEKYFLAKRGYIHMSQYVKAVLLHAIMDALLGATALGDIGKHFPDNDEKYRGADSLWLLECVRGKVKEAGYVVGNVDATIIAQKPKMRPYIESMRENVAKALCVDVSQINIKATTEEGLGFTGSGQGISAQAICLLEEEPVLI